MQGQELAQDTDLMPEQAEAEPEPEPEPEMSAEPASELPPEAEISDLPKPEAEEAVEGEVLEKETAAKEGWENLPEVDETVEEPVMADAVEQTELLAAASRDSAGSWKGSPDAGAWRMEADRRTGCG